MVNSDLTLQWSKLLPLTVDGVKNASLNEVEGVYRISKKESDGKFYVIFIGSAFDLNNDLLSLLSTQDFLKRGGDFSFRYAPVKDEEVRKTVEKQMYKQYAPEYNTKEPSSSLDVKVNLN